MGQISEGRKGKNILTALQAILDGIKLSKIRSDKGSEFVNAPVKNYLKKKGISFFSTNNPVKASLVERVQRTFKQRLFRYLRNKRNDRYIDVLQKLVNNYTLTPHSSLNNTAPKNVNKNNEADIWAYMYLKNQKGKKTKRVAPYSYKVGDYVRISYLRHPFRKSYEQQFTTEIFRIKRRWRIQGIPVYKIASWDNIETIEGNFYNEDLKPVDTTSATQSLFFIDRIISKRKIGSKLYYLVKWTDYPSRMNSYVLASDVKTVK